MIVLGLGGILTHAACAILKDGHLMAAVEEEKLDRHRIAGEVPEASIAECLRLAGVSAAEVDCLALVRPFAGGAEAKFHLKLRSMFPRARLVLVEHQVAHAASAYFASPFEQATVLTLDRGGDLRCGAKWQANGPDLRLEREWYYPDSLGLLYGRVTELLGFESRADEHKVQWLAAQGDRARFSALFGEVASVDAQLNALFFDGSRADRGAFGARFYERLGLDDGAAIPLSMAADIAAGVQQRVEEIVLELAGSGENLCVAGGLFFNALLVRALETSGRWKNVFVQAAAGNSGTAIGAAYSAWQSVSEGKQRLVQAPSLLLGPEFRPEEIKQVLENCKLRFRFLLTMDELVDTAVRMLGEHQIIAWMQGRMEFGPRALGNRSILASPLDPYSTENLNVFIKHREAFRKFAASVPAEVANEYFEVGPNAINLATVGRVREAHRRTFESAILGHDLVRVHVVEQAANPLYHRLLHAAGKSTGLPVLYNTSFNLFGDPLVCNPRDAVRSFYSSGIDGLFVGNFLLTK
ncbi:MAG: carbamoyltransferase C-terminal domain-containing protein [Bryobacteraceae bacterium]